MLAILGIRKYIRNKKYILMQPVYILPVYEKVQNFTNIYKKYPDTLVIETNSALLLYSILV